MSRIAAVVVTYNRKELLLQCLQRLQAQNHQTEFPGAELEVIVVDNASTDGTRQALDELIQEGGIRYSNTGSNLGGAGGFNCGMRKAVELGCDYVWIMDDDCMPHEDTLLELLRADARLGGDYGYLSSVVRWTDGSICTMNVQRHPLTRSIVDFAPELQPATLASFVSLFVPAAIIKELGLPIKDFFIWSDDWEFTRRISRAHPCYVVGKSVVTHASKSNGVGNIALDSEEKIARYKLAYRNDVVLYRREGLKGYAYIVVRGLYHTVLVLTKAKSKKLERWRTILQGNLEGFGFQPEIEYVDEGTEDSLPSHDVQ